MPVSSLPRSRRIKQSRDFARARNVGHRRVSGCLILNWVSLGGGKASRLGVVTSRKLGPAVVRSRARRLLREAFRQAHDQMAQNLDVVLVARNSINGKKAGDVKQDFLRALRAEQLLKPDPAQPAP